MATGGKHHVGGGEATAAVPRRAGAHRQQARGDGARLEHAAREGAGAQGQAAGRREPADVLQRLPRIAVSVAAAGAAVLVLQVQDQGYEYIFDI